MDGMVVIAPVDQGDCRRRTLGHSARRGESIEQTMRPEQWIRSGLVDFTKYW